MRQALKLVGVKPKLDEYIADGLFFYLLVVLESVLHRLRRVESASQLRHAEEEG